MLVAMVFCVIVALAVACLLRPRPRPHPGLDPLVFLEGNIGAGKSTLAAGLARRGYTVVGEPVRRWQDVEGHNLLELLYADRPTWNFPFQALALATLGRRQQSLPTDNRLCICERSVTCSLRVFAQYLADEGALQPEHMAVLRVIRDAVTPASPRPVGYLYVRTPPEVAVERCSRRGRPGEAGIQREYFHRLHDMMDAWLLHEERDPVHVLDGNLPPMELLDAAVRALETVAARTS